MGVRDEKKYRVLSLDGGGTWALIQAKVLMDLYPGLSGHEILREFDVVAGTSGGSVVMAGLIEDMAPVDILRRLFLRRDVREQLFCPLPWYRKLLRVFGIGPQFDTAGKLDCLRRSFPRYAATPLGKLEIANRKGVPIRFLVTAYDYDRDRAVFFRSDPDSAAANFPRTPVALAVTDAVHASSTAPVQFFDLPAAFGSKRYWDGAVTGMNNPVLAAVAEAIAAGMPADEIGVLSIGTGNTFLPTSGPAQSPELVRQADGDGLFTGVKKLASAVVADPPDTDTFLSYMMLGGYLPRTTDELRPHSPLVRLSPLVRPNVANGEWTRPEGISAEQFKTLTTLDIAVTDDEGADLIVRLCDTWMAGRWPNQPVRHGSDLDEKGRPNTEFCEIGQRTYAEGKAAW